MYYLLKFPALSVDCEPSMDSDSTAFRGNDGMTNNFKNNNKSHCNTTIEQDPQYLSLYPLSLYIYIYTYTYIDRSTHLDMYMYRHTYIQICMHYTHMYEHAYLCIYGYLHICIHPQNHCQAARTRRSSESVASQAQLLISCKGLGLSPAYRSNTRAWV